MTEYEERALEKTTWDGNGAGRGASDMNTLEILQKNVFAGKMGHGKGVKIRLGALRGYGGVSGGNIVSGGKEGAESAGRRAGGANRRSAILGKSNPQGRSMRENWELDLVV